MDGWSVCFSFARRGRHLDPLCVGMESVDNTLHTTLGPALSQYVPHLSGVFSTISAPISQCLYYKYAKNAEECHTGCLEVERTNARAGGRDAGYRTLKLCHWICTSLLREIWKFWYWLKPSLSTMLLFEGALQVRHACLNSSVFTLSGPLWQHFQKIRLTLSFCLLLTHMLNVHVGIDKRLHIYIYICWSLPGSGYHLFAMVPIILQFLLSVTAATWFLTKAEPQQRFHAPRIGNSEQLLPPAVDSNFPAPNLAQFIQARR